MIEGIYKWITENHEWFFSGIGVLIISFLLTYLFRKKNQKKNHFGDSIFIHNSEHIIGKVQGNVEINIDDQQKRKN